MGTGISIKKAALINAGGKYIKIILQLLISAILSRLLSAEDYGIVAVITVFSTFFSTFADMGFGTAIVQNKELSSDDIDNIYSFTAYISIALTIFFALASYLIASFYSDAIYIRLGQLLSIALLFNSLNMVPNGILNRDKQFTSIAVRTVVIYSLSSVVAIVLAFYGFRYYAIIIQSILTAFLTFFWNYISTKPKFKLRFDLVSIRKVANYSGFQFLFNVVNYFSRNLDNLLTGKFMGNADLGYYNKAYNLMLYPVNNLSGVISPVMHPILADFQNDKDFIYKKYMKVNKLLSIIGIYVSAICFLGSSEIISIMYGSQWSNSAKCFQILSIAILPQMLNSSVSSIFQALGNTKLLFANGLVNTLITIIAILIGVFTTGNIVGLSTCIVIAYLFHFCTATYMLVTLGFGFRLRLFLKDMLPEIVIYLTMVVFVYVFRFTIESDVLSLLIKSVYISILFFFMLILTREHRVLLNLFQKS